MTLTVEEIVELTLDGAAVTEPGTGRMFRRYKQEACVLGALALGYQTKYGGKLPHFMTELTQQIPEFYLIYVKFKETHGISIWAANDSYGRDEAIRMLKELQ